MDLRELPSTEPGVTDLILRAVAFAAHKHRDQRRKDKEASPYINHPIELAHVLWDEGEVRDPLVIAAALLHDTLEDTETSWQELRGEFGEEIADIVLEVTDTKWLRKEVRKRLQVAKAKHSSQRARLVKLAARPRHPRPGRLVAGTQAPVLRLGKGSGRPPARHPSRAGAAL